MPNRLVTTPSSFACLSDVTVLYPGEDRTIEALSALSLSLALGSKIAILGPNGSGKSTLAKLLNALLTPTSGVITLFGEAPRPDLIYEIRRRVGMVFQNPDNQIVGTTVEEDVAFGPENIGMPRPLMLKAIDRALDAVGLADLRRRAPSSLSGGQKQKLAIASALAMAPDVLVMDEATAMLDPVSRREIQSLVADLHGRNALTLVTITHDMTEALDVDHVVVMDRGRIQALASPRALFSDPARLIALGLDVPAHIAIADRIARAVNRPLAEGEAFTFQEAIAAITARLEGVTPQLEPRALTPPIPSTAQEMSVSATKTSPAQMVRGHLARDRQDQAPKPHVRETDPPQTLVRVSHLSYVYDDETAPTVALRDVSFSIRRGEILAVVGHSGSGKSTLIQHLNGLIRPPRGVVTVLDLDASEARAIAKIRRHVGLVFQYPEHQLFESTVARDIAFGLNGQGLSQAEIDMRVAEAMARVGLDRELMMRSPFSCSGGQKRRIAIAGVLVMRPDILVLDEPQAGLDPAAKRALLRDIARLREQGVSVVIVSHDMDDIAPLADRLLILKDGAVHGYGTPQALFSDEARLAEAGLMQPATMRVLLAFQKRYPDLTVDVYEASQAADALLDAALSEGAPCARA